MKNFIYGIAITGSILGTMEALHEVPNKMESHGFRVCPS